MNRELSDLIYLCRCSVNGEVPEENRIAGIDTDKLYSAAKAHALIGMVACALESTGVGNDKFAEGREMAARKNLFLDAERNKLLSFCEENGIWYMPLKGSVIKDIYPDICMRQMSDNDILFDGEHRLEIKKYFKSRGYTVKKFGDGNHDIYEKPPVLNFEMHVSLFSRSCDRKITEHYRDVKLMLIKDPDNGYGYHFSDEDFYVYIVAHEYRHFVGGGIGLRSLIDRYVYLQKYGKTLAWDRIEAECAEMGISDFEAQSRSIFEKLFGGKDEEISEEDMQMLELYLSSGASGVFRNYVMSNRRKFAERTGKKSRFSYIMYRIFPDREWFETFKPFYNRHPYLKPFYVSFRFFRKLLFRNKNIAAEIRAINDGKTAAGK